MVGPDDPAPRRGPLHGPAGAGHAPAAPTVPPSGPLDPLLSAWLRSGPAACPRCGYDLTAAVRPTCPECGRPLSLRVDLAEPYTVPWTIVLALLALAPGCGVLFLGGAVLHELMHQGRLRTSGLARETLGMGIAAAVPLVVWIAGRRRFVRLGPAGRRTAIAAFTLLAAAGVAAIASSL